MFTFTMSCRAFAKYHKMSKKHGPFGVDFIVINDAKWCLEQPEAEGNEH